MRLAMVRTGVGPSSDTKAVLPKRFEEGAHIWQCIFETWGENKFIQWSNWVLELVCIAAFEMANWPDFNNLATFCSTTQLDGVIIFNLAVGLLPFFVFFDILCWCIHLILNDYDSDDYASAQLNFHWKVQKCSSIWINTRTKDPITVALHIFPAAKCFIFAEQKIWGCWCN